MLLANCLPTTDIVGSLQVLFFYSDQQKAPRKNAASYAVFLFHKPTLICTLRRCDQSHVEAPTGAVLRACFAFQYKDRRPAKAALLLFETSVMKKGVISGYTKASAFRSPPRARERPAPRSARRLVGYQAAPPQAPTQYYPPGSFSLHQKKPRTSGLLA